MLRRIWFGSLLMVAGCQSGGPFPDFVSSGPATTIKSTGPCGTLDMAGTKNVGAPYYECSVAKDGTTTLRVGALSSDAAIVVSSAFSGATSLVSEIGKLASKGAVP